MNLGGELGNGKMPVRQVIEDKYTLALHRGVCRGLLINASRNPINQQFAPLYVCPGTEGSRQLLEHGLNGSGEDVCGIFQLGNGRGRASNDDQVALWGPPCGRYLDIGVAGGLDKGIVADHNQQGRGHTSLGAEVGGSSGVEKGNDKTSPCRKPRDCGGGGVRSGL